MLQYRTLLLSLLCYGLLLFPAYGQANPFLKQNEPPSHTQQQSQHVQETPQNNEVAPTTPSLWREITGTFRAQQAFFQNQLAEKSHELVNGGQTQLWFVLIITAFLYGAFHSLGPGHGKCVVCSYFTAEAADIKRGLLLGYLVALIHAVSAFAIVSVVYFFLRGSSQMVFDQATRYVSLVSYGLITLLGFSLLLQRVYGKKNASAKTHHHAPSCDPHGCEHDHSHAHAHSPQKNLWLAALAIGIIPCPGALTILLFSLSLNTLSLGIILASMIALGMGLTISLLAVFTVLSRRQAFYWLGGNVNTQLTNVRTQTLDKYLGIGGALTTCIFGGTLFLMSWKF